MSLQHFLNNILPIFIYIVFLTQHNSDLIKINAMDFFKATVSYWVINNASAETKVMVA